MTDTDSRKGGGLIKMVDLGRGRWGGNFTVVQAHGMAALQALQGVYWSQYERTSANNKTSRLQCCREDAPIYQANI